MGGFLHLAYLPYTPALNSKLQWRIWKKVRRESVEEEWIKDLWLSQEEEERKKNTYSRDILCGAGMCLVLTNADMPGTHTEKHLPGLK